MWRRPESQVLWFSLTINFDRMWQQIAWSLFCFARIVHYLPKCCLRWRELGSQLPHKRWNFKLWLASQGKKTKTRVTVYYFLSTLINRVSIYTHWKAVKQNGDIYPRHMWGLTYLKKKQQQLLCVNLALHTTQQDEKTDNLIESV